MNIFPALFQESKKLIIGLSVSALLIIFGSLYWGIDVATQVGIGVLISTISTLFYTVLAWAIIVKKNIAWMGRVIVIKYSILIVSIYYVWTKTNVQLVVLGLTGQVLLTAVIAGFIKIFEKPGSEQGSTNEPSL